MRTRTKKRICITVGAVCLIGMLCVVGGVERGWADISTLWRAFVLEVVGAAALWKAGWIRWLWL